MTASRRFPSLFFRQDLNGIGIPFLTASLILFLFPSFVTVLLSVFVGGCFLAFSIEKRKEEKGRVFLLASLGITLALLSLWFHIFLEEKSARLEGQTLEVAGYVTEVGEEFSVISVYAVRGKLHFEKIYLEEPLGFSEGDRVKGRALFRSWAEHTHEGDASLGAGKRELKRVGKSVLLSFVSSLRKSFADRLGSDRVGGFYRAILLGERSHLMSADKEAFRRADSSHLLAISGLHVTQLFGLFYFVFRYLPIGKRLRYCLLLPVILLLFLFTGGSVSVFRASVMAAFPLVGKILSRRSDSVTALVFAACLLVLWEPACILTPSFLLSFTSAFSIVYASSHFVDALQRKLFLASSGKFRFLKRLLFYFLSMQIISVILFVFGFPVQLLLFGEIRPLAPIFAAVLIPIFSPCLILGIARGIPLPFSFPASLVHTVSSVYAKFYLDLVRSLSAVASEPIQLGEAALPVSLAALAFLMGAMILKVRLRNLFYGYGLLVLFSLVVSIFLL